MATINKLLDEIIRKTVELSKLVKLEFPLDDEQDSERSDEGEPTPEELQEKADRVNEI